MKKKSEINLILPSRFAPGHKLQKPSKESGIFQSLGTVGRPIFIFYLVAYLSSYHEKAINALYELA